jgi:hypothetical protein
MWRCGRDPVLGVSLMDVSTDYEEIAAVAADRDMSVCATFRGETPVYFLAARDASDADLRELSFEAQVGRPMSPEEHRLVALVLKERPGAFDATVEDLP